METVTKARMQNPAMVLPQAMPAIQALIAATHNGGVPASTLGLTHLRASQINGAICAWIRAPATRRALASPTSG
jgi:hypothetical protein